MSTRELVAAVDASSAEWRATGGKRDDTAVMVALLDALERRRAPAPQRPKIRKPPPPPVAERAAQVLQDFATILLVFDTAYTYAIEYARHCTLALDEQQLRDLLATLLHGPARDFRYVYAKSARGNDMVPPRLFDALNCFLSAQHAFVFTVKTFCRDGLARAAHCADGRPLPRHLTAWLRAIEPRWHNKRVYCLAALAAPATADDTTADGLQPWLFEDVDAVKAHLINRFEVVHHQRGFIGVAQRTLPPAAPPQPLRTAVPEPAAPPPRPPRVSPPEAESRPRPARGVVPEAAPPSPPRNVAPEAAMRPAIREAFATAEYEVNAAAEAVPELAAHSDPAAVRGAFATAMSAGVGAGAAVLAVTGATLAAGAGFAASVAAAGAAALGGASVAAAPAAAAGAAAASVGGSVIAATAAAASGAAVLAGVAATVAFVMRRRDDTETDDASPHVADDDDVGPRRAGIEGILRRRALEAKEVADDEIINNLL